ncbi:hypothetical protein TNCV_3727161 [Trichonephila clavipes]|nr:hypothetical protein TNCV_3727161 [Trichonephila clavipes]
MLATALSSSDTCHVKAHVVRSPPRTGAHGLGGRPFPPSGKCTFCSYPSPTEDEVPHLRSEDRRRFVSTLDVTNAFRSTNNVYFLTGYSIVVRGCFPFTPGAALRVCWRGQPRGDAVADLHVVSLGQRCASNR